MTEKKTVLCVTNNKGGAMAVIPIAKLLRDQGHAVLVVSEGLSNGEWKKAEWPLVFEGSTDLLAEMSKVDAQAVVRDVRPDVVVSALGSPMNLEQKFSQAANAEGIPLAWVEDVWGCTTRAHARPDLIVTLDEIGEEVIRESERFPKKTKIVIAGNAAVVQGTVSMAVMERFVAATGPDKHALLLSGQGEHTRDIIAIALASLKMTDPHFICIPRLHPKHEKTYGAEWRAQLGAFEAASPGRIVWIPNEKEDPNGITTDQLAMLCHQTVSTYGTSLMVAAQARRLPISVLTPFTQLVMKADTGLDRYPLAVVGAAVEIAGPVDLYELGSRHRLAVNEQQDRYCNPKPGGAATAAEAILALCP